MTTILDRIVEEHKAGRYHEYCEWCGSEDSREVDRCGKCGGDMKAPLGKVFGVPIYDIGEFRAVVEQIPEVLITVA